ncbi:MAG: dethiobiotin synthase [Pseudomonadota bacterium]|nr:dethiobiotin synthase [Pseudomonadota bacterium]
MINSYFITGTDTDVGKTTIALGLVEKLQQQGYRVGAMKPLAAGCEESSAGLRNSDAVQLQRQADSKLPYEVINPYAFAPPIAPHIAAAAEGVRIDIETIYQHYQTIAAESDCVIVEGAGGWQVPLNDFQTIADLAKRLQLPVILVVGMRLGCISHALLSVESIHAAKLPLAGWVANQIAPEMNCLEENIATLQQRIEAPLLGHIPYLKNSEVAAMIQPIAQLLSLPPQHHSLRPDWAI